MAADLHCREGTFCHVLVKSISGGNYESMARIVDGLLSSDSPCDLILSDLTDYCLHDLEECSRCKFEENRKSLVLGKREAKDTAVVFFQ